MLIKEMHYDFKIKSDKIDSLKNRNFLPAEIDWLLNLAIQNFVDNKYDDFETKQDLIDQLSTLTVKSPTSIQPGVSVITAATGVYEMKLEDLEYPYLHLVRLNALATKTGCSNKVMKGNEVTHDTLDKVLLSPFEGPNFNWLNLPYVFGKSSNTDYNSSIYLYTNGEFGISEVYPEYLRIPKQVFYGGYTSLNQIYTPSDTPVDCDLPPAFHRRIVDIAVAEASDYINKPDFPQKLQKTLIQ